MLDAPSILAILNGANASADSIPPVSSVSWADDKGQLLSTSIEPVPLAPSSETDQLALLNRAHQEGHFGTRAMYAHMRRSGMLWNGMSTQIRKICQECLTCQRWNTSKKAYHPLHPVVGVIPWDVMQMDLITSFPPSSDGFKVILILTDVFSSFCLLRALENKEAKTVARYLWQIFADFGPPRTLQSDNDSAFMNEIVHELVSSHGIAHRTILPYNSRSAGKVERHVGLTSVTLRKMLTDTAFEWPQLLPLVQLLINQKHKNLTNSSPFALVFGRVKPNLTSFTANDSDDLAASADDLAAWLKREQYLHDQVFPVIRDRQTELQRAYTGSFKPSQTTSTRLPVGSVVMLFDFTRKSKNAPPWTGPYSIVRVTSAGAYTLRDFSGVLFHRDVPRDALKLIDSADLKSALENTTLRATRITNSRVAADGSTDYLVRWAGFADSTWVPSTEITDPALVDAFLAQQKATLSSSVDAVASTPVLPDSSVPLPTAHDILDVVPAAAAAPNILDVVPADPVEEVVSSASPVSSVYSDPAAGRPRSVSRRKQRNVTVPAVSARPVHLPCHCQDQVTHSSRQRSRSPPSKLRDYAL